MKTNATSFLVAIAAGVLVLGCGDSSSSSTSQGSGGPGGSTGSGAGTGTSSGTSSGTGGTGPGACPVFPADNPWNTDISNANVDPLSDQYLASIGLTTAMHPDFGTIYGIPFVNVDDSVTKSTVTFDYFDESDPGPYPIPQNPPIEDGSDHHILMIHNDECKLYELFAAELQTGGWHAGSGAIFDLTSNMLRPDGWTSADAAGLPIYPGLARYDEATGSGIHHALRFTVSTSQSAYVFPARHAAGSTSAAGVPPMGMRVRLKASFDTSVLSPQAQAVAQALQTYGMIVADNGSDWYITGAPDSRWDDDDLHNLNLIHGSDFEVIETGPLTPQ